MINLKKILLALVIACSLGGMSTYSSVASAYELRENKKVIKDVLGALNAALASIDAKEAKEVSLGHVQQARQFSKEINIGSLGAIADRGADAIIKANGNLKRDNPESAVEYINAAIKEYQEMAKKTL